MLTYKMVDELKLEATLINVGSCRLVSWWNSCLHYARFSDCVTVFFLWGLSKCVDEKLVAEAFSDFFV